MRNRQIFLFVFVILVALAVAVGAQQVAAHQEQRPFSDVVAMVHKGEVASLTIKGTEISGMTANGESFRTTGPLLSDYYLEDFAKHNVVPNFEDSYESVWYSLGSNVLFLGLGVVLFLFMMRQLQAGSGRAMSFGKARARLLNSDGGKRITFSDVAGCDEAKDELQEIIQFLKDPRKFTRLGGRIPKGVLLMGSPGTGKTLLARAVAGEAGVPFFSISGSDFVEMFVGVGASRVRDLFEQAKKQAPCIIFIDEIDAVGRHRGAGMGGGHDEREQTLNQLLVEMDGFESNEGVILIAATNRPDVLDPALQRPGRFDRRVVVPPPDIRGRLGILQVHARRTPLAEGVDLESIAKGTAGFSGADLENLINEAALIAARLNKRQIEMVDLEQAKDKVAMGSERRSLVVAEPQKRRTAYHEAGHAIVARLMPHSDPVNKITIIPRGMALGLTQIQPAEDRLGYSKGQLRAMLAWFMGGRAAEEEIFQEISTGASNDIKRATQMAAGMVREYGMSPLGPIAFGEKDEEVFLGRDFGRRSADYSEETAQKVDAEIHKLLREAYQTAQTILRENRHILERVAGSLLEKETLDGAEFEAIVSSMNPIHPRLEPMG